MRVKRLFNNVKTFISKHKVISTISLLAVAICIFALTSSLQLNALLQINSEPTSFDVLHRTSSAGCYSTKYKSIIDSTIKNADGTDGEITAYCADRVKDGPHAGVDVTVNNDALTDLQFNVVLLGYSKYYKDIDGDGNYNGRYFTGGKARDRRLNYFITQLALWSVTEGWPSDDTNGWYLVKDSSTKTKLDNAVAATCSGSLNVTNEELQKVKDSYKDLITKAKQLPYSQDPKINMNYHAVTAKYAHNDGVKTTNFIISKNNLIDASYKITLNNAPSGTKVYNAETDEEITGKSVRDLNSFYFTMPKQATAGSFTFDVTTSNGKYMKVGFYESRVASDRETYQPLAAEKIRSIDLDVTSYPTEKGTVKYNVSNGGIRIFKTDSANSNTKLGNAIFKVSTSSGTEVLTQGTDGNGQSDFGNLAPGNYIVEELSAPEGYNIVTRSYNVTVNPGEFTVINITNDKIKSPVRIYKKDDTGGPVKGAKFQITNSNGDVVYRGTTDEKGRTFSGELPYGTYTVTETSAPAGYNLANPSSQTVNITESKGYYRVDFVNPRKPGTLKIVKTDENGGVIEGVQFEIYKDGTKVDTVTTNANGVASVKLEEGTYTYKEVSAPAKYIVDSTEKTVTLTKGKTTTKDISNAIKKGNFKITKVDSSSGNPLQGAEFTLYKSDKTTVVATATTDANGIIEFNDLPYGIYWVKETKALTGYNLMSDGREVIIRENGKTLSATVANSKIVGKIKLTKTSTKGGVVAGAKFNLLASDRTTVITTGVTDSNGVVEFNSIPYGTYYLQEYEAPQGYLINTSLIEVKITSNGKTVEKTMDNTPAIGSIKLVKTDSKTGAKLEGVKFKIYDTDGTTVLATLTTDVNGEATLNHLMLGTYYYQEIEAPSGYILDNQIRPIEINTNGQVTTANVTNTKKAGKLQITKKDAEDNSIIPNAKFRIYASDGTTQLVDGITNANGIAEFTLEAGSYFYQEYEAPSGYVLNDAKFPFTITDDGQVVQATVTNTKSRGEFTLVKTDASDKTPLPGATFEILASDQKTVVYTGVTDENGKIQTTLLTGSYYYRETKAPSGYVLDSSLKPFEIENNGQIVTQTMTNSKIKGNLLINKIGKDDEPLQGAEFTVYAEDKSTVIARGSTDKNGELTFNDLPYGTYYYKETKAPKGYVLDDSWRTLNIQTNNQNTEITVSNTIIYGTFKLTKTTATGKALPGTVIKVTNLDTNEVFTKTTDDNGIALFTNLVEGNYSYQETKAPEGYVLDSTAKSFTITSNGQTVTKDMTNNEVKNTIMITKSDSQTGELIPGAVIGIYNAKTNDKIAEATTNSRGVASFANITYGSYYYKEITPPSGYTLNPDKYPFEVTADGVTQDLDIKNDKEVFLKVKKEVTDITQMFDDETFTITVTGNFSDGSTSKVLTFTKDEVKNGTKKEVPSVSYGEEYTISESPTQKYTTKISDETFTLNGHKTITVTNTPKSPGTITITKKLGNGTVMQDGKSFKIRVTGRFSDTDKTSKVLTVSKASIGRAYEIPGIVYGETYTITEENNDSYSVTISKPSVTANGTDDSVIVTNTATKAGSLYVRKEATATEVTDTDSFDIVVVGKFSDTSETSKTISFTKDDINTSKEVAGVIVGETYKISESPSESYTATISDSTVNMTNESKTVTVTNTRKTPGKLNLTKVVVDNTGTASEDYVITVSGQFSDTSDTTKTYTFTQDEVKNKTVKEVTGVLYGCTYEIREQENTKYIQALSEGNVTVTGEDKTVTATNKVKEGEIELTKKDVSSGKVLPNAKIRIKDATGNTVAEGTTDSNGYVKFSHLVVGTYTYEEYEAPSGYVLDTNPYPFEITDDGQIVKAVMTNKLVEGKLEIAKTDATTKLPLANATIAVKDKDGKVIAEKTTDENGVVSFDGLPYGTYTYVETKAPSGYVLNTSEGTATITTEGQTVKGSIQNTPAKGEFELTKKDVDTGNVLPNAKFEILASDKTTVVASGITDNNGKFTVSNLIVGDYYYRETEAPSGYVLDNSIKPFKLTTDGEICKVDVTNSKSTGKLEITKKDEDGKTSIPNAKFKIYADDKTTVVTQGITDDNGVASFTLPVGTYYYQEYESPSGYILDSTLNKFVIENNDQIIQETVTNKKARASIKIVKFDGTNDNLLAGVTFDLYNDKDEKIDSGVTDDNGELIFDNLVLGDYYVKESKALDGYLLNDSEFTANLTANGEVYEMELYNYPSGGDFTIVKHDDDGNALAGAKFRVYDETKTNILAEGVTDNEGVFTFNLPFGDYYVQEIEAPEGFVLDNTFHKITLENQYLERQMVNRLSLDNERIKGSLVITKLDSETNTPLKGAKFKIFKEDKTTLVKEVTTDENGQATVDGLVYGTYYYQESESPSGYVKDDTIKPFKIETQNQIVNVQVMNEKAKGQLIITKTNDETNINLSGAEFTIYKEDKTTAVKTVTTDNEGKATFELPLGTYYYKETSTPRGYHGSTDFVKVELNTNGQKVEKSVDNTRDKGEFKIIKKDAQTGALLKGAKFEIYKQDQTTLVTEGYTNDDGEVIFTLPSGTYYYKEVEAPTGYILDSTLVEFSITKDGQQIEVEATNTHEAGQLEISKTDVATSEELKGAKFRIYASDKTTVLKEGVTDDDGKVTFTLPTGTYYYQEYEAPTNYLYDTGLVLFEIKTNNEIVKASITNEKAKANLKIVKVDGENNKPLNGAKFQVLSADKTTVIHKGTTDENGEIVLNDLELGTYYYQEYEAPEGYVLDQTIYPVSLTTDGETITKTVTNITSSGELEITKKDLDTGELLDGATYQILAEDGTTVLKEGITVDGKATFTLSYGKYFYREIKAPSGYILDSNKYPFSIANDGDKVEEQRTNEKMKASILLVKTDEDNTPISGVKFKIFESDKTTLVKEITTNDEGKATISDLPLGTYYYQETETPNKYILDDEIKEVKLSSNNQIQEVNVLNEKAKGSIDIYKESENDRIPLAGAEFAIYNDKDEEVARGETNSDGHAIFNNLPLGNYYFKETKSPSGYVLKENKTDFTISQNGEVVEKTITNGPNHGDVEITKTDITTDEPLPNATITLKKEDGTVVAEKTTGDDGVVKFTNLVAGKYIYVETIAPDGYLLNSTEGTFEIKDDGQIVKANIKDTRKKGSLEITKTDIKTNKLLAGAKFQILAEDQTTVIASGTTNDNGVVTFDEIPTGNYYYQEIEAPSGYVLDNGLKPFTISDDKEVVKAAVTNSESTGKLEITKKSEDGSTLIPNAKFRIYASDKTTIVTEGVTDDKGIATFVLPVGTYFYQEYEAPVAYIVDDSLHEFTIKDNNQVIQETVTNTLARGSIKINKYDGYTNNTLAGVQFELYDADGNKVNDGTTDDNGELTFDNLVLGSYTIKEVKTLDGYALQTGDFKADIVNQNQVVTVDIPNYTTGGDFTLVKKDDKNKPLQGARFQVYDETKTNVLTEGETNAEGKFTFNLPYGNYFIKESVAPSGYVLDTEYHAIKVEPVDMNNTASNTLELSNNKIKGGLKIVKSDAEDNTPISGVEFTIYGDDQNTVKATGTTNDKGEVEFADLEYGTYYYQETKVPNGYVIDDTKYPFEIQNNNEVIPVQMTNQKAKGKLKITKINKENNITLAGAEFTIYAEDKTTEIQTIVTDNNGEAELTLPLGTYYYKETKVPATFHADSNFHEFKIENNGDEVPVTVNNDRDTGKLQLTKKDISTGDLIPNAKFRIYADDRTTVIVEGITDDKGIVEFTLPSGTYYYQEYEAPTGYILDDSLNEFTISKDGEIVKAEMTNTHEAGQFEISKVDVVTNEPLEGAKFRIYASDKTTVLKEGTTDENGKVTFVLPTGSYFYEEYEAPKDYNYTTGLVPFELTENNVTVKATVTNEKMKANLKITKVDGTDNSKLAGAKFNILAADKTTIIDTQTTDDNGEILINNLDVGTYYYQEVEAPTGYVIDSTLYEVNMTEDKKTYEETVSNTVSAGELEITKTDLETGDLLDGAKYQVLADDKATVVKEGTVQNGKVTFTLPYGSYCYQEVEAPTGYVLDSTQYPFSITTNGERIEQTRTNEKMKGNIVIHKTDEDNNKISGVKFNILADDRTTVIQEITTDANGEAEVENLPVGTYYYQETSTPNKYVLDDEIKELTLSSHNQLLEVTVVNEKAKGSIDIYKVNEDVDNPKPLAGAEFVVFDENDNEIARGETDSTGHAIFNNLPVGNYYFKETKAPSGYSLKAGNNDFEITHDGQIVNETFVNGVRTGKIEITKTDITTSEPLPNATITIKKEDGTVIAEKSTGADGKVTFENIPAGKYIYVETIAPSGYKVNTSEGTFEITQDGQIVKAEIQDERYQGSLKIIKTDGKKGTPLAGAEFVVLKDDQTTVVANGTTDVNGELTIPNLDSGDYFFQETKAPSGYDLDNSVKPFSIVTENEVVTKEVINDETTAKFQLTKTDVSTGELIPNVKFKIYADDKTTLITEGTTDDTGIAEFTLPLGTYYYQEYEAPSEYVLNTDLHKFTLVTKDEIVKDTMTNEKKKASLKIIKVDGETNKPLQGAEFEVLDENGKSVATGTTDENGEVLFENLILGNYSFREVTPPSGYILDDSLKPAELQTEGEVVEKTVTNDHSTGDLEITKKDISTGELLPNAKFRIYADNKTDIVVEGITDDKGLAKFTLKTGTYYYQEYEAPEGYVIDDTLYEFTIDNNGDVVKKDMPNTKITGGIQITKTDVATGDLIPNAKFTIYAEDGTTVVKEGRTDDKGIALFDKLEYGTYYYQETEAPEGYNINEGKFAFKIENDGEIIKAQMTNTKSTGTLKIHKANNEYNINLAGAQFTIYESDKTTEVGTITTDNNGNAEITLPLGTYYYKETLSPNQFHGDTDFHEFKIESDGQEITEDVNNIRDKGKLKIVKTDVDTNKPLEGAIFEIYKEDQTTKVTEGTTDANGEVEFELPTGKYYYKEAQAPTSYILDDTFVEFDITKDGEVITKQATNVHEAGQLEINKTDVETNRPLQGAKFRIYAEDKTTILEEGVTNQDGKATFNLKTGKYYYQEYESPTNYLFNDSLIAFEIKTNNQIVKASVTNEIMKASIKIIKVDNNKNKTLPGAVFELYESDQTTKVGEYTTDDNGEIQIDNLVVGTYYFKEIQAPTGYILDSTMHSVDLTENQKVYSSSINNDISTGQFELTKKDVESGVVLPGAKYQILAEDGNVVNEGVTDQDGKFTATLEYGKYFYQEIEAPTGYILDSTKYEFNISTNGEVIEHTRTNLLMKGSILITKKDEDNKLIEGVKFKLFKDDQTTLVGEATTDANGQVKFDKLPLGTYYYQEVETPNKYVLADELQSATLENNEQLLELDVINKKAKGSLDILKQSSDKQQPLSGAEFTVYDENDKEVDKGVTGTDGHIVFNDLLVGNYYVKETKAPVGYVLNTTKIDFSIDKHEQIVNKTVDNDRIKADFEITKKDISNGDLVPNTSFRIYKENKTTVVTEGVTDENGIAKFKDLEYGKYYYQEFDAPEDFVVDTNLFEFEIKENGVTVKAEMSDKLKDGKLILTKKDDEGSYLADVPFKVYSEDKKTVVKEGKTDTNGKLEFVLQPGTYYYQEVETPSGYIKDDSLHEFKIERGGKTTEIDVVNKFVRASVIVNKTGTEINTPLAGCVFKITKDGQDVIMKSDNGETISTFTTDKDGKIQTPEQLKMGNYQLVELSSPSGYLITEPIDFEVVEEENGKSVIIDIKDKEIKGNIKLVKYDEDDKTLQGVKFKLIQTKDTRGNDIEKEIGTYTTDSNGEISVDNLLYGDYYIQEVETVEGYVLDDTKIEFSIVEDGKTVDLNKVNKYAKGNVILTKVDSRDNSPLEGVVYELYNSKDELQGEYTTNPSGEIEVNNLRYGEYYFKEKETIEGYVKSSDKVEFKIQEDGSTINVEARNDRITGEMELTKTDVVDGEVVPNANFEILAEDKETVIIKGTTDKNGIAKFKLDYGKYYYREYGAPEGYVLDDTPYPFEIKSQDEIVKCEMTNKPITGELEITKKDIIDGELIPNAKFEILNEDKEVVKKGTTDENGIAKFNLDYGKYYYHEYDAPSGYILDDKLYPFEIKTNGEIVKCIATNRKEATPSGNKITLPKTGVISIVGATTALATCGIAVAFRKKNKK